MDSRDIIACIKKYPVIYDLDSQRTLARRDAWKEVAAELNADGKNQRLEDLLISVAVVQKKWKNLRDSYVKYLTNYTLAFRLNAEMKFLKPYLQNAKPPNVSAKNSKSKNVHNRSKEVEDGASDDGDDDDDDDDDDDTSVRTIKRKVKTPNYNESDSSNETESPTAFVSENTSKPRNLHSRRKQVKEDPFSDEEGIALRASKKKSIKPNVIQSDSSSESSEFDSEPDISTNTITDDVDNLKWNESNIVNSALVDEEFVSFANRAKKLSQTSILSILTQVSQIIGEKEESERNHLKIKIKLK